MFFEECGIAKNVHGGVAGFFWTHAPGDILGDLLLEMELDFVVQSLRTSVAPEESLQAEPGSPHPLHDITIPLSRLNDQIDCRGEAAPVGGFLFELSAACRGQRIKLGLSAGFGFFPFGFDPGFLLQAVQGRVERALLDLQYIPRNLLNTLGDGPAMLGLERNGFENQEIQSSLNEVVRFSHAMTIYSNYCR